MHCAYKIRLIIPTFFFWQSRFEPGISQEREAV